MKKTKRILSILLTLTMIIGVSAYVKPAKAASLTPVGEVKIDGTVTIVHPGNGPVESSSDPLYSYAIVKFTTDPGNNGYFFDIKNDDANLNHDGSIIVRELRENYDYYDGWLDDPNCWNAGDATFYKASLACDKESGKNDDNTINRHEILHPNTTYYLLLEGKAGDSISVTVKKIPMRIEKRKIKPAFAKKTVKKKKVDRAGYYRLKVLSDYPTPNKPHVYWKIKSCPKNGKEYVLDGEEYTGYDCKRYNDSLKLKYGIPKGKYKIELYSKAGFCPRDLDQDWKEIKTKIKVIVHWIYDYYYKTTKTITFTIK